MLLHLSVKVFALCHWMQGSICCNLMRKEFRELFKAYLGVSISVNPADNGEQFSIDEVGTKTPQEVLKVSNIDEILVVSVNSAEGSID